MNKNTILVTLISLILISLFLTVGCKPTIETPTKPIANLNNKSTQVFENKTNLTQTKVFSQIVKLSETTASQISSFYKKEALTYKASVPSYNLPLNLTQIQNYDSVSKKLDLLNAVDLLKTNGFVVINYGKEEDMVNVYKNLKKQDIPIFITSDTLLHLYHIQFDETLKDIEEREFYDDIKILSKVMLDESLRQHELASGDLKEASKRNAAFFSVGLKILDNNFEVPNLVKDNVESELNLIEEHNGFTESPVFNYKEDYSQYMPRGHYTRSEKLKQYFKAMMWYGRMSFLLKGSDSFGPSSEAFISKNEAKIQTLQASLITVMLDNLKVEGKDIRDIWNRIYSITAFYVGLSDDLTFYEFRDSIKKTFGASFDLQDFNDEKKLLNLKGELATLRMPKIYGGTGECSVFPPFNDDKLNQCLDKSKGFRIFGQRFVPDAYMFQNLIFPIVTDFEGEGNPFTSCRAGNKLIRCFPQGLDVTALLGSNRSYEISTETQNNKYKNYNIKFNELKNLFDSFSEEDWYKNLYWGWLYSLKPLLQEFGDGYPTFMQTKAWQDKELNAVLSSWTELRHDTILYAKQGYTIGTISGPPPYPGYVEPVPEFYSRLLTLTKMTKDGLNDMGVLDIKSKVRLDQLQRILEVLIEISTKELNNEELTDHDYGFIGSFDDRLEDAALGVSDQGLKTTLVADVHTNQNTKQVLEEGVGYVKLIVVAYPLPDGKVLLGAGPVMSYYEFKHPMVDRLTDEKWREMLQKRQNPEQPEWTRSFIKS
ncbi:MAG: DUF3160 domain-containing protein [Nanoarchaeota archaeon]